MLLKVFSGIIIILFSVTIPHVYGEATFGWTTADDFLRLFDATSVSSSCAATVDSTDATQTITYSASGSSGRCHAHAYQWDISSIPDDKIITNATIRLDIDSDTGTLDCQSYAMVQDITTATDEEIWDDLTDGNQYFSGASECDTTGNQKEISLGTDAIADIQASLSGDYFGISLIRDPHSRTGALASAIVSDVQIEIVYVDPPEFTISQVIENIGDIFKITGSVSLLDGDLTNVTSIIVRVNGTAIDTNSTFHNQTEPYTISYGPIWEQITDDDVRNFTSTVTMEQLFQTYANESKTYLVREYDPDYIPAVITSQGDVNYTAQEDGLHINRDKSGATFQIECGCLDYAAAFLNNTSDATWTNETAVASLLLECPGGTSIVACYNEDLLFITSYPANSSNILVSGTAIFDQLGGFMGAPAALLVVLAIYSLGTGRNFPIISVVAMSTIGVMGAFGLLILSGEIWALLMVITGLSIFGVRKFF